MNFEFCHHRLANYHPVFSWPVRVWLIGFLISVAVTMESRLSAQDKGLNTPLSKLQNQFADLMALSEKKIPRSQKYQILNKLRHRLKASKDRDNPQTLLNLANQYRRYLFYKEAIQLYEEVARNSANDDTWLMQANRWLGEIEFVANDDAKTAIKYLNKSIGYSPKDSITRGNLLGRLGSYYFIDNQIDQMLKTYQQFNQLPELTKAANLDTHLKANLYSARFTKDADEAAKFFEQARKIAQANPKEFPPDFVLGIFSEQNNDQPWNSPSRIKRLVLLVENKDYSKEPKTCEFAMEVLMAYFLEREKEWNRFEKFAEKTLKLLSKFESKDKKNLTKYSLASQAIGIQVGAAAQSKQKWDEPESRRDFQQWQSKLKKMNFYFPYKISNKDFQEIMKAYQEGAKLLKDDSKKKVRKK